MSDPTHDPTDATGATGRPAGDTGPLPAITAVPDHAPDRLPGVGSAWRSPVRETSVDELFHSSGPSASVTSPLASSPLTSSVGTSSAGTVGIAGAAAAEAPVYALPDADVDEAPDERAVPAGSGPDRAAARHERLRVVADTGSSRVPLGLLWFALGGVALAVGPWTAAVVFAPVAVVGAIQTATALRRDGARPRPLLAGAIALGVVLAALAPTSRAVGAAVLAGVAVSLAGGLGRGGYAFATASASVRSWLGASLAAAVPVALAGYEPSLAVLVFLLACAYDAGDYLVGSASASWFEGPAAGALGLLAVGFGAAVLQPGALSDHPLWPAVLIAAVACPAGQLLASLALPDARAFAPGLRRLDSLVAVGVAWLVLFG
jgi:hypothetical protein